MAVNCSKVSVSIDDDQLSILDAWRTLAGDNSRSATLRRVIEGVARRPATLAAILDIPPLTTTGE